MAYTVLFKCDFFEMKYKTNILYIKLFNINCEDSNQETVLNTFFSKLDTFYKHKEEINEKFGKIYDITELGMMPLDLLHTFSKGLNNFKERTENIVTSSSVIVKSIIIKGFLNIFLSLYNNTRPLEVFDNLEDSEEFINQYIDSV
jgi:endo-1,4-beta-D-glucanase Y